MMVQIQSWYCFMTAHLPVRKLVCLTCHSSEAVHCYIVPKTGFQIKTLTRISFIMLVCFYIVTDLGFLIFGLDAFYFY